MANDKTSAVGNTYIPYVPTDEHNTVIATITVNGETYIVNPSDIKLSGIIKTSAKTTPYIVTVSDKNETAVSLDKNGKPVKSDVAIESNIDVNFDGANVATTIRETVKPTIIGWQRIQRPLGTIPTTATASVVELAKTAIRKTVALSTVKSNVAKLSDADRRALFVELSSMYENDNDDDDDNG